MYMKVGSIVEFGRYFISNGPLHHKSNVVALLDEAVNKVLANKTLLAKDPLVARYDMEPLKWRVLARENDRALLITEKAIECEPFDCRDLLHCDDWCNCSIREWLNSGFKEISFNSAEQCRILAVNLSNNLRTDTKDMIFLLSKDEAQKYFYNDADRRCEVTLYAKQQGAKVYPRDTMFGKWWLRSLKQNRYGYGSIVSSIGGVCLVGMLGEHRSCRCSTHFMA